MPALRASTGCAALLCLLASLTGAPAVGAVHDSTDATAVPGAYIVVLEDRADVFAVVGDHRRRLGLRRPEVYRHSLPGYAAAMTAQDAAAVRRDPRVRSVTPDRLLETTSQLTPTGHSRIESPPPRAASAAATDVRVAVIDIGIDGSHPDLSGAPAKDCSAPGTPYNPWHGTAVAGTIGARDDDQGVVGVAPGVALHGVRVTDVWPTRPGTQTTWSSVVCAVDWVTSTRVDDDPDNDVDVANMSLAGDNADDGACGRTTGDALHQAICASTAAGVLYAVAAGNDGEDFRERSPANYDEVLTVTGVADSDGRPGGIGSGDDCFAGEEDDAAASFSNFATLAEDRAHTIAAPAVCIRSTAAGGGYEDFGGTSMAAPHVAGAAALCIGSGRCRGSVPEMMATLRADAIARTDADGGYGFLGDLVRPLEVGYFGPLVHAGAYSVHPPSTPEPEPPQPPTGGATTTEEVQDAAPVPDAAPEPHSVTPQLPDAGPHPPVVVTTVRLTQSLRPVLRKGLAVRVRTHAPARVDLDLLIDRRLARQLRLDQRVAAATLQVPAAGAHRVTVKLPRAARRKLVSQKRVALTVSARATDAAGTPGVPVVRATTLEG